MVYSPRFYHVEEERLRREHHDLLALFYNDVDWYTTPDQLVEMTQFLVSATRIDPLTNKPTERWVAPPSGLFRKVDQERLAKLLDKAGYVDEVYELNGLRPAEIEIAFVPGGRAHSQWIRLSEVISSWTKRRIRPRKIVFVGDRDKDPHGRDVAEDFHYVNGKPPPGCEPYKPGVVPPTDEDLPEKSFERWMMKWFWANLEKPDELEEVEVEYFDSLEDYFKVYTQRVRAVYYTINPHRFHLAKFRRTAPRGSRVAFIACAATLARSDVRYLADAWAREILETYLAGFRVYGRSSVIPPQILKLMQEMERLARLN